MDASKLAESLKRLRERREAAAKLPPLIKGKKPTNRASSAKVDETSLDFIAANCPLIKTQTAD